jgi:hypothetical protein
MAATRTRIANTTIIRFINDPPFEWILKKSYYGPEPDVKKKGGGCVNKSIKE